MNRKGGGARKGEKMNDGRETFDQRRYTEPQVIIDLLLAQTSRQGGEIYRLNQRIRELERRLERRGKSKPRHV